MSEKTIAVVGNEETRKKLAEAAEKTIPIVGDDAAKAKLVEMAKSGTSKATLTGKLEDQSGHKVLVLADAESKK